MSTVRISKEKLAELEKDLKLCLEARPEIIERVASARELGDLKENAEYHSARDEQRSNESKIEEIEKILKNYELVEVSNSSEVEVGVTVKLSSATEALEDEKVFTVVSSVEADPLNGKISDESPVGQALIGKKVGEDVEIGGKRYKLEEIS